MKPYTLQLEISSSTALWTRPDTGSSPVSYVAPTFSAVKGIFEAILRWKSVRVRPVKVEICRPIQFLRYVTNYGGSLRGRRPRPGRVANASVLVQPPRPPKTEAEVARQCGVSRLSA
ncbi:MAG: CRISPR-associated protein Cas5 [Verrucomicrobia bacterium]|jgi:CRISPR-associated Cas5-like protein|nr:CRISPR-associated protein Cas5 [Verrucomicrobiota bacterium]